MKKLLHLLKLMLLLPVLPILGAVKVMPAADAAAKWAEVAPQRQTYYEAGVKGAGDDWEKNTKAAAGTYKAAVSSGNIDKLYAGGVARAGSAKYVRKAGELGPGRYAQGIPAAVSDYQSGVEPFLDEVSKLTLSPRQPRGSEANFARSREVGVALHKKRLALRSAGA